MLIRARIAGLSVPHTRQAVQTALTPLPGITAVDIRGPWLLLEHDGQLDPDELREAIAVAGYEVAELTEDKRRLPLV